MGSAASQAGSGALSGAATGATVGSVIPGLGTAVGAGVGAVIGGISGFLKGKSEDDAKKAEAAIYNEWLKDRSKNAEQIAADLAARGIDLYGPEIRTTTSEGQSYMQSVTDSITKQQVTTRAEEQPLESQLRDLLSGRLGQSDFITDEEKAAQASAIAASQRAAEQRAANAGARMGVGATTMQSAMLGGPAQVAAGQQRLQALAGNAALNRSEAAAARGESAGFLGQRLGSTSKTHGTQTSIGNTSGTQTATGGTSDILNRLMGFEQFRNPGPQANTNTGYSPTGAALGAIGDTVNDLAGIYGAYQAGKGGGGAAPAAAGGGAAPAPIGNPFGQYKWVNGQLVPV